MSKKGISQIKGPSEIKIGETAWYEISRIHRLEDQPKVVNAKWELSKRENGKWRTLRPKTGTPPKVGAKVPVTITNPALVNQELLIEAYIYEVEKAAPPGLKVKILPAIEKKITRVELFMADDTPITKDTILKYNQTIKVKVYTQAMQGEMVTLLLYEDDATGGGHDAKNEPNKVAEATKTLNENGFLWHEFRLLPNFSAIANAMKDGSQDKLHEYYVVVKTAEHKSVSKNANVENPDYVVVQTVSGGVSPVTEKVIEIEEVVIIGKKKTEIGVDPIPPSGNKPVVVADTNVEDLLDAYFAKEEYTKETNESAGNYTYAFKNANNNIDKDKIAAIIKKNVDISIKADKKYTKLEPIKNSLVKTSYAKGETISFATYKLGPQYTRINSAPLEEEVFVVASTLNLEGKEVSINIYEKEEVLKGKFEIIPVLEAKENGAELTTLKAAVENGIAKVKVKLRPKADEDLKTWKEKLANGIKEGTHKYIVKNTFTVSGDLDKIASNIEKKSNEALAPKHTVKKTDISALLAEGATYTSSNSFEFPKYKKTEEMFWLKARVTGKEEHSKEFLKEDGKYFVVGKGKYIIFPLRVKPRNDINGANKRDYWAADNRNQTNFGYSRGARIHAARDLETESNETVVAIAGGTVLEAQAFYRGTHQVTIHHIIPDGREFIVRYGELDPNSLLVNKGDIVKQGQELGKTGRMTGISRYMVHFEQYTGSEGFEVVNYRLTQERNPPFSRRRDLIDSLEILQEGYENTFGNIEKVKINLFTVDDGKKAIRELYNKYKNNTWNWKWNGSDTEIPVTGKDLLTIVEKMYRLETTHFTSGQYQNCGTGGMEAFGSAPYYGWDSSLFTEIPVGTWSAYEGPGLSGSGGNAQVTNRPKEFVKLPSVITGMEYKIKYIIKYDGNYARWFNKNNATAQASYRSSLVGIRARFVQEIAGD